MDQINIDHSHLTVVFKLEDATVSCKKMLTGLFDNICMYKIKSIDLDLKETGEVYNSLIIGTIVGVCKLLLGLNMSVSIINSPIITENMTTYSMAINSLQEQGIKVKTRV